MDAGTLSTLSALNCMAGGSRTPSLVLDSNLNTIEIAIWGDVSKWRWISNKVDV